MEATIAKKASLKPFEDWIDCATSQNGQYREFPADNEETAATGFAWSLYSQILKLFETLFPVALRWPQVAGKSMRDSLGKLLLWGDEVGNGQLEQILDESEELKDLILDSLAELGGILTLRLVPICQSFAQPEENSLIQDLVRELNILLEKLRLLNENDCEDSGVSNVDAAAAESMVDDRVDMFLSIKIYATSLIELLPSMENTLDYICNSRKEEAVQPIIFEVSGPAQTYVLHIYDQFPKADCRLVERLGEANWQRHTNLRERATDTATFDTTAAAKSVSGFVDSGLGMSTRAPPSFGQIGPKSVFVPLSIQKVAQQSKRAQTVVSHSSFMSTASDMDRGSLRVPPTPKEVLDGVPFICCICTRRLDGIKNRIDWKRHVFEDLNTYLCTFSGCKEELVMFPTRELWEEHEFAQHRYSRVWVCPECPQSFSSLENWKVHISSSHDVLFSGDQYKAMIRAVEHKITQAVEALQCPLCLSLPKKTRKNFTTHVAKHMERIALAALPRESEVDTDDASDSSITGKDPGLKMSSDHTVNPMNFTPQGETAEESQILKQDKILDSDGDSTAAASNHSRSDDGDPKDVFFRDNIDPARRRPFSNNDRIGKAKIRVHEACVPCRMQRIRCVPNPSDPMGSCVVCLYNKILDIRLFLPGPVPGLEWTQRWPDSRLANITDWASSDKKTIETTDGYGSEPVTLEVREFIPAKGDVLHIQWWAAGMKKEVSVPPYALAEVAIAKQAYEDYTTKFGTEILRKALKKKDKNIWETYSIAIKTANHLETPTSERTFLKSVLHLWVVTRLTSRSFCICGEDTLGMPQDILDENSSLHGKIPIPPVMRAQIELILIQEVLVPLREEVLNLLQQFILKNTPKSWFTIYLCNFILLHNCSLVIECDAKCAISHNFKDRYAWPTLVEELHDGANTLLAYWHCCNKGLLPFSSEIEAGKVSDLAERPLYQTEFVKETQRYLRDHENEFEAIREQRLYENDYYFISQLYEKDWRPVSFAI